MTRAGWSARGGWPDIDEGQARLVLRRDHYHDFYDGPPAGDLPLLVVLGNCQAESFRLLLDADDVRTVRMPPVHELTPDDVQPLQRLMRRADLVVAQPTADGHRGLPLGTAELLALARPGARHALVNPIRFAGLHPTHLVVHPPGLQSPEPPVVPYHDVRDVVAAAWERAGVDDDARPAVPTAEQVLAVAELSRAELRRREALHGSVVVSDLLERPSADTMRTINHPGNAVLAPVAARLRDALGLDPRPPGVTRPLLDAVHAPLEAAVVSAYDLTCRPRPHWVIDGQEVEADEVGRAHRSFYRRRPDVLDAVLQRARPLVDLLGLAVPPDQTAGRGPT